MKFVKSDPIDRLFNKYRETYDFDMSSVLAWFDHVKELLLNGKTHQAIYDLRILDERIRTLSSLHRKKLTDVDDKGKE
jgi:hypothetical protein